MRVRWGLFGLSTLLFGISLLGFQNCGGLSSAPIGGNAGTSTTLSNPSIDSSGRETQTQNNPLNPSTTVRVEEKVCTPPRHYSFVLPKGQEKFLTCAGGSTKIFEVQIPDEGAVIGRSQIVFHNNDSKDSYYWNAAIIAGTTKVAYGSGDDICPGQTSKIKTVLGSGVLDSSNNVVTVVAHQGSTDCKEGTVSVFSGATLDVWVEDPDPSCAGKDLQLISSYDVYGVNATPQLWATHMEKLIELPVPKNTDRSQIQIFSSVEGTPLTNPNKVCGQESATLIAQVTSNSAGILATEITPIPASSGMGHLVLNPEASIPYFPESLQSIGLLVGSNTALSAITTGGCCGDGKIAFIKSK